MKISYFENVERIIPAHVDVISVLNGGIKSCRFAKEIDAIRNAKPDEQERLKKMLPGVTFGGTFSKRSMKGLIQASGLLCLDFDEPGYCAPDSLIPFVFASFRSPRGGLKVVVRIPVVDKDEDFKAYFRALEKEYPDTDPSSKDISRICFLSADADLYLNECAQVWDKRLEVEKKEVQRADIRPKQSQSNWAKIAVGLKMIRTSQVGNRHNNALKAGQLMGGYIASGEIDESDIEVLVREIEATSTEPADHTRAFMDGVNYGKSLPLTTTKGGVYSLRKEIKAEWKASEKLGDIYYTMKDEAINDEIDRRWKSGNQRGVTTGWPALDALVSYLLGYITIIYGPPAIGKSLWAMNQLINLSKDHNWTHCLFTPEMGTPAEVFSSLIQIYVGRDIDNTYGNRMTKEQLDEAKKFIDDHFIILDNEESGEEVDIETLCLYVEFLERKMNKKVHTITVDPLIELMQMDSDTRDDIYWNQQLKRARVMAKSGNHHIFMIHHTKDPGRPAGQDDYGNFVYPPESPHNIAFGQTFYRKAFFMINIWYHYCPQARTGDLITLKCIKREVRAGHTYVRVVKAKPEGAGERGEVELRFSKHEHQFFDDRSVPKIESPAPRDPSAGQRELALDHERFDEPIENEDDNEPSWLKGK